jgi:hypothetical protein
LEQTKPKRDQPTRAPTFDLQFFLREVFGTSSCSPRRIRFPADQR